MKSIAAVPNYLDGATGLPPHELAIFNPSGGSWLLSILAPGQSRLSFEIHYWRKPV